MRSSRSAMVARRAVSMPIRPTAAGRSCSGSSCGPAAVPRSAAPPRARRSTGRPGGARPATPTGCRSRGWPGRRPRRRAVVRRGADRLVDAGAPASGELGRRRRRRPARRPVVVEDHGVGLEGLDVGRSGRSASFSSGSQPSVWSTAATWDWLCPSRSPAMVGAVLDRVLADDPGQHDLAAAAVDELGEQLSGVEGEAERGVDEDLEPLVDRALGPCVARRSDPRSGPGRSPLLEPAMVGAPPGATSEPC